MEDRKYTIKLIGLCEDGILNKEKIFDELMSYLSEDEVKEFCLNVIVDLFKELEESV